MKKSVVIIVLCVLIFGCAKEDEIQPSEEISETVFILPVVVHIIHIGEEIGTGFNLSQERIIGQIEILNNDFRKKEGTLGYNTHPLGTDSEIQFKLAEISPDGTSTDGVNRVDANDIEYESDSGSWLFDNLPYYGYWDTLKYVNIWVFPSEQNLILGQSSVPKVNLPGLEDAVTDRTIGVMITTPHFGTSNLEGGANLGRTLTHEMGHFLGLEHLWGKKESADCMEFDDYCDDTPFVSTRTRSCDDTPTSCNNEMALTQNYMDYTDDACMNMFTKDQVERMRYVLKNNETRKLLSVSAAINRD